MNEKKPRVGLFVTCLVDFFRPTVGFAAIKLLESSGCEVHIPENQTCCGQPAYNTGDQKTARRMAARVIKAFEKYDHVVIPSGSCAAMMKHHYPRLFKEKSSMGVRAQRFSGKVFELTSFLTDVMKISRVSVTDNAIVTYHDSCAGLRELGIKAQPRQLLAGVSGLSLREMDKPEVCCGFGGTFCMKFPEISNRMTMNKIEDIRRTGADTVLGGDLGCLLTMASAFTRAGIDIKVRHVAEVLAGIKSTKNS